MILPTIIETFVLHKQSAATAGLKSPASRAEPTLPGFHSHYKPSRKKVAARHSRLAVSRVAATLMREGARVGGRGADTMGVRTRAWHHV